MLEKDSRFVKYIATPAFAILVGLMIGYQAKSMMDRSQPVTHDMAVPWSAFDEGYRALMRKDSFLYAETLKQLQEMEGKPIAIYGYIFPIEQGEEHSHFLLSARASSCPFCMPAGAGNLVEVRMEEAIAYQRQPVLLKGIFTIGDGKETGLVYSIHDAEKIPE